MDAGGVAYRMSINTTYDALPKNHKEQRATLYTYLSVREDGLEPTALRRSRLSAFRMLITVSGVGPKVALSLLSVLSPIALAVLSEDRREQYLRYRHPDPRPPRGLSHGGG